MWFLQLLTIISTVYFCSVPIFKSFPEDTLIKISDVLEETHYNQGDYIVSCIQLEIFLQNETSAVIFFWFVGTARCSRRYILHHFERYGSGNDPSDKLARREIYSNFGQRWLLWWKGITRVNWMNFRYFFHQFYNFSSTNSPFLNVHSDDLRTANIICDSEDGVTCLVIDRETFKQLISNLDEIRNKYNDESSLERKR